MESWTSNNMKGLKQHTYEGATMKLSDSFVTKLFSDMRKKNNKAMNEIEARKEYVKNDEE